MMKTKIGVISDLHLFNKTANAERAISKFNDAHLILIVGDIADRADKNQYDILLGLIKEKIYGIPVYCVSGNHDNPARDDTSYRQFESNVNSEYPAIVDECGALCKIVNEHIDIIGLNPLYYQKQFFFTDKGKQLAFLQERLSKSSCKYHIVLCHPPLISHNPQRTVGMSSYIVAEQDERIQKIIDGNKNVIFISGHTHVSPTVEFDEVTGNLYINDGSLCPTTAKDKNGELQQGNVTLLEISENEISVIVKGIRTEEVLFSGIYAF